MRHHHRWGGQYIFSGGTASDTTIDGGGTQIIYDGGTASGTIINNNGEQQVHAGGTASGTIINSNGEQNIYDGGTASDTTIDEGGTQRIYDGGTASDTTINEWGVQNIYDGGTASGTTINDGGLQFIVDGGTASDTTINEGAQYIYDSGTASGTTINEGAQYIYDSGTASGTTINAGGGQQILSGGTASGTTINEGAQYIYDSGTASGTTINGGGTQMIYDGGTTSGTTVNNGGKLALANDSAILQGTTLINTGGILKSYSNVVTNNGVLEFNENASRSEYNDLQGSGSLVKSGSGTLMLSGNNTYSGGTSINDGTLDASSPTALGTGDVTNHATLNLNATGEYILASLTTDDGGVTSLAAGTTLTTGTLNQQDGSTLNINLGDNASSPVITADSASLDGTLNITGIGNVADSLQSDPYTFTLIDTNSAISGDFDTLTIAGMDAKQTDFLTVDGRVDGSQYQLATSLSWYADVDGAATDAHGTFTLSNPDGSFEVSSVLTDVSANSGWDGQTLTKAGDGILILSAANTYSGDTNVNAGTLWLTDTGVIGATGSTQNVNVASGATFGGTGVVNGNISNSGSIAMSQSATETGHTLTINGDYSSNNGSLYMNTYMGDDSSPTDKLVITGDTSGKTTVYFTATNPGEDGAATTNGIEVIDVGGSSGSEDFKQGNRVVMGAYEYRLYQHTDSDWYLESKANNDDDGGDVTPPDDGGDVTPPDDGGNVTPPDDGGDAAPQYRADIGAYLGNQWMARNLQMQTLYDREGSQLRSDDGSVWMRFKAGSADSKAAGGNVDIDHNYSQIQFGGDIAAWGNGEQSLTVGLMGSYINADSDSTGNKGADGSQFSASGNVDGCNLGVYATWFADAKNHSGLYVDSWYQYGFYNNSVDNEGLGSEDYDSSASAVSLETGYRYDIALSNGNTVSLTPQAQATWQHYDADSVTNQSNTRIDGQDSDSWTTRLGLRVDGKLHNSHAAVIQPFMEANWLHTSDDTSVSFNDVRVDQDIPANRAELKVGIQANLNSQWSVSAQAAGQTGSNDYRDLNGSLNVRYSW
nr:autotransporter outer membrane beta-barrel domain-containing protein [Citrobacter sp. C6_1]